MSVLDDLPPVIAKARSLILGKKRPVGSAEIAELIEQAEAELSSARAALAELEAETANTLLWSKEDQVERHEAAVRERQRTVQRLESVLPGLQKKHAELAHGELLAEFARRRAALAATHKELRGWLLREYPKAAAAIAEQLQRCADYVAAAADFDRALESADVTEAVPPAPALAAAEAEGLSGVNSMLWERASGSGVLQGTILPPLYWRHASGPGFWPQIGTMTLQERVKYLTTPPPNRDPEPEPRPAPAEPIPAHMQVVEVGPDGRRPLVTAVESAEHFQERVAAEQAARRAAGQR